MSIIWLRLPKADRVIRYNSLLQKGIVIAVVASSSLPRLHNTPVVVRSLPLLPLAETIKIIQKKNLKSLKITKFELMT